MTEHRQIRVDVQREAVHRPSARDARPDGADLARVLSVGVDPHALVPGEVEPATAFEPEGSQRLEVAMPKLAQWMADYRKERPDIDQRPPEDDI